MKNFIVDIEGPSEFVKPYAGIGIGYANIDADFNRNSGFVLGETSAFAWQPIGGVAFKLNEKLFYYVEYRYFSTTDLNVSEGGVVVEGVTYNAHNLFMGLRCEF
jgi:opacity protein-like surface antigen